MDIFRDKVAIVTGGASGIGKAVCEELGRRGTIVVVTDVNQEGAEKVAAAISSSGGRAEAAYLNVTEIDKLQKFIEDMAAEHGRLDYMFNNAGIATLGEVRYMTPEQWRKILDINLMGVVYGTTAAYAIMVKQGFGHIVNTASHAGLHPVAGTTSYAATKHGVVGLSTALRAEGADLGVKVTVVCPGPVKTPIFDSATLIGQDKEQLFKEQLFGSMPDYMMEDVNKAAEKIINGIIRNQAIIVFPTWARVMWLFHRFNPGITEFLVKQMYKGMRKLSEKS